MRKCVRIPGSQLVGSWFSLALVALLVLDMVLAVVPATAQTPSKIFSVGHLAAPGRTPDGAPAARAP